MGLTVQGMTKDTGSGLSQAVIVGVVNRQAL